MTRGKRGKNKAKIRGKRRESGKIKKGERRRTRNGKVRKNKYSQARKLGWGFVVVVLLFVLIGFGFF